MEAHRRQLESLRAQQQEGVQDTTSALNQPTSNLTSPQTNTAALRAYHSELRRNILGNMLANNKTAAEAKPVAEPQILPGSSGKLHNAESNPFEVAFGAEVRRKTWRKDQFEVRDQVHPRLQSLQQRQKFHSHLGRSASNLQDLPSHALCLMLMPLIMPFILARVDHALVFSLFCAKGIAHTYPICPQSSKNGRHRPTSVRQWANPHLEPPMLTAINNTIEVVYMKMMEWDGIA